MSENIMWSTYLLAEKFISKGINLERYTDWNVYINYTSSIVEVCYFKNNKHWFMMQQCLILENAEQNLTNFIHNIDRLEREYFEQIKQN